MNEKEFHFNLTAGLTASMLLAFFILTFTSIRAPYGRYGKSMVRFALFLRKTRKSNATYDPALYDQSEIGLDGSGMSDTYLCLRFLRHWKRRSDWIFGESYLIGNVYFPLCKQNIDISVSHSWFQTSSDRDGLTCLCVLFGEWLCTV